MQQFSALLNLYNKNLIYLFRQLKRYIKFIVYGRIQIIIFEYRGIKDEKWRPIQSISYRNTRKNSTYKNEIGNFSNYLKDRLLEDKIFHLNQNHIDDYFVYSYDTKIGAVPTLTTHISALKFLFDELIKRQYDFKLLYAYIDTAGFKEKLSENLEKSFKKTIIDNTLLTSTLYKIDTHIKNNINTDFRNPTEQKRFFEIMIARLYAKLSLIIPLKTSEMIELKLNNIQDGSTRSIEYNEIVIKLP